MSFSYALGLVSMLTAPHSQTTLQVASEGMGVQSCMSGKQI